MTTLSILYTKTFEKPLFSFSTILASMYRRHRNVEILNNLSDHQLNDIGISREDILSCVKKTVK